MRLFHTSDTHLGHQQYAATDAQGLNQREQDIAAAFLAVVDRAVAARPDAFVHAGDLFDGVRPSNRALATALEGFLRLSRAGIPTIVIAGNHEHPKLRGTGSPFRLFEHLDHVHPVYKGKAETVTVDTPAGTYRVHAVPQCADNDVLAAEIEALDPATRDVLVVHGAVHQLDAFRNAEFNELTLQPRWFTPFEYVALGHYHGCHEVAANAWYCGAPERVSMAEAGETKGFLDVRLGPEKPDVRHEALPGRPYMDLPAVDGAGLDADGVLAACREAAARVPAGAVARLRVNGLAPHLRGVLDVRALRAVANGVLHFDLRLEWEDSSHRAAGGQLRGLADEFEAYAATHPVEGLQRERLLRMARELLAEAR